MQQDALLRQVAAIRRLRDESFFMNILVRHPVKKQAGAETDLEKQPKVTEPA